MNAEMKLGLTKTEMKAMSNHFKPFLSFRADSACRSIAAYKWQLEIMVKSKRGISLGIVTVTYTDGGNRTSGPIRVSRSDIERAHDWAEAYSSKRNYLIFRGFMKIGFRTGEECTLKVGDWDHETLHVRILDSKKYCYFTNPIDVRTSELVKAFNEGRSEDEYQFVSTGTWAKAKAGQPLHPMTLWYIIRNIGRAVGIENLRPRDLRHYFAVYEHYVKKLPLKTTQTHLRHSRESSTEHYTSKLVSIEDTDRDYHEAFDSQYFNPPQVCSDCSSLKVCKFVERMPEFATGCAFKNHSLPRQEER